jgi:hypothetical protein
MTHAFSSIALKTISYIARWTPNSSTTPALYTTSPPTTTMSESPPLSNIEIGLFLSNDSNSPQAQGQLFESHEIKVSSLFGIRDSMLKSSTGTQRSSPENSQLDVACNDTSTQDLRPELAKIRDLSTTPGSPTVLQPFSSTINRADLGLLMVEIAYLMRTNRWSISKALEHVSSKR